MKEFVRQIGKHLISFIVVLILSLCCMTSCSITAHIPENEVLYNGVDHIELHPSDTVNADVESGDVFGVIGMSGAGKSTLYYILNFPKKIHKSSVTNQSLLLFIKIPP